MWCQAALPCWNRKQPSPGKRSSSYRRRLQSTDNESLLTPLKSSSSGCGPAQGPTPKPAVISHVLEAARNHTESNVF